MRILGLQTLRHGPALFTATTSWPALAAVGVSVVIFVAGLFGAQGMLALAEWLQVRLTGSRLPLSIPAATVLFLLGLQLTITGLVLMVAGWRTSSRSASLLLAPSPKGGLGYVEAIAGGIGIAAVYNAVAYGVGFTDLVTDLKPFIALLASPWWALAALVVAVGAPLAEELLFRGFLLPALSRTRLGFLGAALVTTLAWTAMHAGYTPAGMVEVFLMGLYFGWLLWRTGSLRVPLVCHAAFNTAVLLALLVWTRL